MKKIALVILIFSTILIGCRNSKVKNTNFSPKLNSNSNYQTKKEKVIDLETSIGSTSDKYTTFYWSKKDSFVNLNGYSFYINPYIVQETGVTNRISLRVFAKVVSNKENIFDSLTFFDEKGNKIVINFANITREYQNNGLFITESAHSLLTSKDIKTFEKFIDSKELYVIFEKNERYQIKLPYPVRDSILDVIRKYKLLQEIY